MRNIYLIRLHDKIRGMRRRRKIEETSSAGIADINENTILYDKRTC